MRSLQWTLTTNMRRKRGGKTCLADSAIKSRTDTFPVVWLWVKGTSFFQFDESSCVPHELHSRPHVAMNYTWHFAVPLQMVPCLKCWIWTNKNIQTRSVLLKGCPEKRRQTRRERCRKELILHFVTKRFNNSHNRSTDINTEEADTGVSHNQEAGLRSSSLNSCLRGMRSRFKSIFKGADNHSESMDRSATLFFVSSPSRFETLRLLDQISVVTWSLAMNGIMRRQRAFFSTDVTESRILQSPQTTQNTSQYRQENSLNCSSVGRKFGSFFSHW